MDGIIPPMGDDEKRPPAPSLPVGTTEAGRRVPPVPPRPAAPAPAGPPPVVVQAPPPVGASSVAPPPPPPVPPNAPAPPLGPPPVVAPRTAGSPPNSSSNRYRMPDSPSETLVDEVPSPEEHRWNIEPWLAAMLQAEHVSLLIGSGFSTAVAHGLGVAPTTMGSATLGMGQLDALIDGAAAASASRMGRGGANIEDQLRSAHELRRGLQILSDPRASQLTAAIDAALRKFLNGVLDTERRVVDALNAGGKSPLDEFLLSFASRSAARDRLHLFVTNYDRLVELGCERIGVRLLDRFVGSVSPVFRSSRLDVDIHYNPPGIRGEPRLLEGVAKLTKLHGSVDWRFDGQRVRRVPLPWGGSHDGASGEAIVIYPNASKDVETSAFPYAELFRDFSAAIARPNSVLITYGYGFGDSHINAAIEDMLSLPSTHLLIISWDDADGRVTKFVERSRAQISYLIGNHFADLSTLVANYLPKPAIDRITSRRSEILQSRGELPYQRKERGSGEKAP